MKRRSLITLIACEIGAMSLWFISSAILPAMLAEVDISSMRQAALASAVQIGFVLGAIASASLGLSDRFDPRRVFATAAALASIANLSLIFVIPGSNEAIVLRLISGAALAGVYPVGMKIVVGWGVADRGLLVGLVVGALTLGSGLPHLFAILGGADWRSVVVVGSVVSALSAVLILGAKLGPHHTTATKFDPRTILSAWTNKGVRLAYFGYLGHMWELYAMWAWIGAMAFAAYVPHLGVATAQSWATLTAFVAIAAGAPFCILAGALADRYGKARVAGIILASSGTAALLLAISFGGPVWLCFILFVIWGITVIPDSALFSALVADLAPPQTVGSLMTFQTALGFALTFVTVQLTPIVADLIGWRMVLLLLAIGPVFGVAAMIRLSQETSGGAK